MNLCAPMLIFLYRFLDYPKLELIANERNQLWCQGNMIVHALFHSDWRADLAGRKI